MSAPMKYVPGGPVSSGMLLALTHFERQEAEK